MENKLTPLEIHVMQIGQTLGRLEGKIDKALDNDTAHIKISDDQETRIRALEKGFWKQTGMMIGISGFVSFLVSQWQKIGAIFQ